MDESVWQQQNQQQQRAAGEEEEKNTATLAMCIRHLNALIERGFVC